MNPREVEGLIQDVLDGQATAEQQARLEAYLEDSELGRARRRELEGLFQALRKVQAAPAPADLRERVLRALPAPASRPRPAADRIRSIRVAYVFAAGLAAGALGMGALTGMLSPRGPGGEPPVTGTMMPARPPSSAVRRAWQAADSRLEALRWNQGDVRLVALQVSGDDPVEVELRYDTRRLEAQGVRQSRPGSARVEVEPGRVSIRAPMRGEYVIEFQGASADAPIQVSFRSSSTTSAGELPAPASR